MSAVAPEALTQHTNPPIRFVAQPDMKENQRNWAQQWHSRQISENLSGSVFDKPPLYIVAHTAYGWEVNRFR